MTLKAKQDLTKTFSIDIVSDVDDFRYQGSFTVQKLSVRDLAALGVRKAQLNGGMYFDSRNPGRGVDENTDDFNNMMAHMELAIKKAPSWWNMDTLSDISVLGTVWKEVLDFENSFLRRAADRAAANRASHENSEGNVSTTNADGSSRQVVGAEVQAALEP